MNITLDKKKRIWEIDFIRGICMILVVLDHLCMVIYFEFSDAWSAVGSQKLDALLSFVNNYLWEDSSLRNNGFRDSIIIILFGLCGISTAFSRSNFKRGIQLAGCALLLSVVSFIYDREGSFIHFGVLHMLAACILLWALLCVFFKDKFARSALAIALGFFVIYFEHMLSNMNVEYEAMSFWAIISENLIQRKVTIGNLVYHGSSVFSPGDYFPLMPNFGYFLIGAGLTTFLYPTKKSLLPKLDTKLTKPIEFIGRNTLWIMLLHIVVVGAIVAIISYLFITKGDFVII